VRLEGWGESREYHRVSISGHLDGIPCKVLRKKARPRKQIKNVLRTGFKIDPKNKGEYFGFEVVGPDNLFLMGDFTVAHNSRIKVMQRLGRGVRKKLKGPNRVYILDFWDNSHVYLRAHSRKRKLVYEQDHEATFIDNPHLWYGLAVQHSKEIGNA